MATKLETVLTEKKIDHRRLLVASRQLERLRFEDRAIKCVQRQVRKKEDGKLPEGLGKPRSGKPINKVTLRNALDGKKLSGATKTRLLRAVNTVLEQRKETPVSFEDLFA
jgi:hypothetical protein